MIALLMSIAFSLVGTDSVNAAPKALLALEQYRARHLRRGDVHWTVRLPQGQQLSLAHYHSRFTNGDHIIINRGDDEGYVGLNMQNERVKGRVVMMRQRDGTMWMTDGASVAADVWPADSLMPPLAMFADVLSLDVVVETRLFARFQDLHTALWKSGIEKRGSVSYHESSQNGVHMVSAEVRRPDGRKIEYLWWLDPKRGWGPVKTEYRQDGKVVEHTEITPKDWGGVWFPSVILQFRTAYENGRKPYREITIDSAKFGGSLPTSLGPREIGIETGTNIHVYATRKKPYHSLNWDGTKGIDPDEFSRKLAAGKLKRGPNFMRWVTHGRTAGAAGAASAAGGSLTTVVDEWERYVRRFIRERDLSGEQRHGAMAVLDDCRKEAEGYVAARRRQFDDLARRAEKVAAGVKDPKLSDARRRLYAPIDAIFDHRLKPRLEALLTAEQRVRQ